MWYFFKNNKKKNYEKLLLIFEIYIEKKEKKIMRIEYIGLVGGG